VSPGLRPKVDFRPRIIFLNPVPDLFRTLE
jgi:hypothetical protein